MFLKLAHSKLDVYQCSKELVFSCYSLSKKFPDYERFAMTQQIRRAGLSIILNLAEGCSRKSSKERNRYFEIARGSLVEVDTCLDVAHDLKYFNEEEAQPLGKIMIRVFQMLSAMINDK